MPRDILVQLLARKLREILLQHAQGVILHLLLLLGQEPHPEVSYASF